MKKLESAVKQTLGTISGDNLALFTQNLPIAKQAYSSFIDGEQAWAFTGGRGLRSPN